MKYTLLGVDALKYEGCWNWDSWWRIEDSIYIESKPTPRLIFKLLRQWGYLNDYSKGKVELDDDGYNLVICKKSNHQPVLALCYGEHWEANGL